MLVEALGIFKKVKDNNLDPYSGEYSGFDPHYRALWLEAHPDNSKKIILGALIGAGVLLTAAGATVAILEKRRRRFIKNITILESPALALQHAVF